MSFVDTLINSGATESTALIAAMQLSRYYFEDVKQTAFDFHRWETDVISLLVQSLNNPSLLVLSGFDDAQSVNSSFLLSTLSQFHHQNESLSRKLADLIQTSLFSSSSYLVSAHHQVLYLTHEETHKELESFVLLASSDRPLLIRRLARAVEQFEDYVPVLLTPLWEQAARNYNQSAFPKVFVKGPEVDKFISALTSANSKYSFSRAGGSSLVAFDLATAICDHVISFSVAPPATERANSFSELAVLLSPAGIPSGLRIQARPVFSLEECTSRTALAPASPTDTFSSTTFLPPRVSSGCSEIDFALGGFVPLPTEENPSPSFVGGFLKSHLTEVYGEAGSGKTQVGLSTVCYNASIGHGAIYLVSEDVPQRRIRQFADFFSSPTTNTPNTTSADQAAELSVWSKIVLDRVFIRKVPDLDSLMAALSPSSLDTFAEANNVSVIVIDSIAACAQGSASGMSEANNKDQHYNTGGNLKRGRDVGSAPASVISRGSAFGTIEAAGAALLAAAARLNVAVVTINQVRADVEGKAAATSATAYSLLPALGPKWSNVVNSRFSLKRLTNTWVCVDAASGMVFRATQADHTSEVVNSSPPQPLRALSCVFSSYRAPGAEGHFAIGPDRLISAPLSTL